MYTYTQPEKGKHNITDSNDKVNAQLHAQVNLWAIYSTLSLQSNRASFFIFTSSWLFVCRRPIWILFEKKKSNFGGDYNNFKILVRVTFLAFF